MPSEPNELRVESEDKRVNVPPEGVDVLYVNSTGVFVSGYDVTLSLQVENPTIGEPPEGVDVTPLCLVKMSHAQAWTAAHIMLVTLRALIEREHRMFLVPADVLERLNLADEYAKWEESIRDVD